MIHLNRNSSIPALKIKFQKIHLTINQITSDLNIFCEENNDVIIFSFNLLYIWPLLSRGHYLDGGLWKVKAGYIVQ